MTNKLMYIPNENTQNNASVDYNQWLKHLDTQLNKSKIYNLIEVPKVFKKKKKHY